MRAARLLALVALALPASCGGSDTDRSEVAAQLRAKVAEREGLEVTAAACEEGGPLRAGDRVRCTATVAGVAVDYEVTVGDGSFEFRPTSEVIEKADLEAILAGQAGALAGEPATVDCGPSALYDAAALASASCTATSGGRSWPVAIALQGTTVASKPAVPHVDTRAAADRLGAELTAKIARPVTASCGDVRLVVGTEGQVVECTATDDGGNRQVVRLTLGADPGTFAYQLA